MGDFVRFDYLVGPANLDVDTGNKYVNNAFESRNLSEYPFSIEACLPQTKKSLTVDEVKTQILILQNSYSEDCLKTAVGIGQFNTKIETKNYPRVLIYPDLISQIAVYISIFFIWNAALLLFFSVRKEIIASLK
jgi:hypothetical protein